MPGIHFVYSETAGKPLDNFKSSLDTVLHDEHYRKEIVYDDRKVQLGITRYPQYPIVVFDKNDYFILLEGCLYGQNDAAVGNDLVKLAPLLFGDDDDSINHLQDWLLDHDGDFLILVRQKRTGRWAFLNDALGRLPVYFCREGNRQYLSREINFFAKQFDSLRLDRMAIAQYLLFGFPLGLRTLISNVERLPPATLLRWGGLGGETDRRTLHQFNFEHKRAVQSISDVAEQLASLFIVACRSRVDPHRESVLSLSGGLDSRAVAAGLLKAGCRFQAVTWEDKLKTATADVAGARELARRLNLQWQLVRLPAATGRDVQHFLRVKGGLLQSTMAFDVSFMQHLERQFGRSLIYFSGEGGNKLKTSLSPAHPLRSVSQLAKFIIRRNCILPLETVAALVQIPETEIVMELESLTASYPEESPNQKYVHFMEYERGKKWLYEGEDRNRCCFWCVAPFYSLPIFRQAMGCPDELKSRHRLYREFLQHLSREAADVVDANRGLPISSPAYQRKMALIAFLARYPRLLRGLKNILRRPGSYTVISPAVQCLRWQIEHCPAIEDYLHRPTLQWLSDHPEKISREVFDNLFTITSVIENYSGCQDSLAHFAESEFM